MTHTVRLDRLIGRKILTANNRQLGRLEECRAERRGDDWVITEWVIGSTGLLERLGVGVHLILGLHAGRGLVARWDQLDISNPDKPRLKCSSEELKRV